MPEGPIEAGRPVGHGAGGVNRHRGRRATVPQEPGRGAEHEAPTPIPGQGYVCVHGHFYQPPRENAWLEAVEVQDSAYPYHDWNERIAAECYGPNGASRILDGEGRIRAISNNYAYISFNFGPTLLSWMKEEAAEAYQQVLDADIESREHFGGHGSALAQAYNHMILPLANRRDKRTQILWGLRDFAYRFGREAEGMWLPETAVDLESLSLMAEAGVKFAILAPHQASRARPLTEGEERWQDMGGGRIDPTRAYLCRLPHGREMALLFYDGPISQAIAFEDLLSRGDNLADRLAGAFSDDREWPQLVHIATDGETYGHHFRHGEMALAYALEHLPRAHDVRLINYAAYLEAHPPEWEVDIFENSSWSCVHGVERWRSDCGCNTGGHPEWNQAWRAPLRESLDWLRDALAPLYEEVGSEYFHDPWAARDGYIEVILDRMPDNVDHYLDGYLRRPIDDGDRRRVLDLLELQRHTLLMYTSCGWFFDELSGIETVQVMQYAARALQLADDVFGQDLEEEFLRRLEPAKSNLPEHGDGRKIYDKFVRPAAIDLVDVGAHFALTSLFEDFGDKSIIYTFDVARSEEETLDMGVVHLKLGRAIITSRVTQNAGDFSYAVLDRGDQNLDCRVKPYDEAEHKETAALVRVPFAAADFVETTRVLDERYGEKSYNLRSAFRDQQRKVLGHITRAAVDDMKAMYHAAYRRHASLMFFLSGLGVPRPRSFELASELVLNDDLREALDADPVDPERVRWLLEVIDQNHVPLHEAELGHSFKQHLGRLADALVEVLVEGESGAVEIAQLAVAADLVSELPFEVDLWTVQNRYYQVLQRDLPALRERAEEGDDEAREQVEGLLGMGDALWVRTD